MGFLDNVKAAAETAATKAKEGVQDVQTKRELGQTYEELGKTAFGLVESGALEHEALTGPVEKIRELTAQLEEAKPAEPSEPPAPTAA